MVLNVTVIYTDIYCTNMNVEGEKNIQCPAVGSSNSLRSSIKKQSKKLPEEIQEKIRFFETCLQNPKQDDDPLQVWYEYVQWTEKTFATHQNRILADLLHRCLSRFQNAEEYFQDLRYLKLWIKYIGTLDDPLSAYSQLNALGIGSQCSLFYQSWAEALFENNDLRKADKIFRAGIKQGAKPLDKLQTAYDKFQIAVSRRLLDETAKPYAAASTSKRKGEVALLAQKVGSTSDMVQSNSLGPLRSLDNIAANSYFSSPKRFQACDNPFSIHSSDKSSENAVPATKPLSEGCGQLLVKRKYKSFHCPVAVFEVPDHRHRPMYPKHKVYADGTEYSLEELKALDYWKHKSKHNEDTSQKQWCNKENSHCRGDKRCCFQPKKTEDDGTVTPENKNSSKRHKPLSSKFCPSERSPYLHSVKSTSGALCKENNVDSNKHNNCMPGEAFVKDLVTEERIPVGSQVPGSQVSTSNASINSYAPVSCTENTELSYLKNTVSLNRHSLQKSPVVLDQVNTRQPCTVLCVREQQSRLDINSVGAVHSSSGQQVLANGFGTSENKMVSGMCPTFETGSDLVKTKNAVEENTVGEVSVQNRQCPRSSKIVAVNKLLHTVERKNSRNSRRKDPKINLFSTSKVLASDSADIDEPQEEVLPSSKKSQKESSSNSNKSLASSFDPVHSISEPCADFSEHKKIKASNKFVKSLKTSSENFSAHHQVPDGGNGDNRSLQENFNSSLSCPLKIQDSEKNCAEEDKHVTAESVTTPIPFIPSPGMSQKQMEALIGTENKENETVYASNGCDNDRNVASCAGDEDDDDLAVPLPDYDKEHEKRNQYLTFDMANLTKMFSKPLQSSSPLTMSEENGILNISEPKCVSKQRTRKSIDRSTQVAKISTSTSKKHVKNEMDEKIENNGVGPNVPDINPFDPAVIDELLEKVNFLDKMSHKFKVIQKCVPRIKYSALLKIGGDSYHPTKDAGKGSYGRVVCAINERGKKVALKLQKPAWPWETYIMEEIMLRLNNPNLGVHFTVPIKTYLFTDGSITVSEYVKYGNIPRFIATAKETSNFSQSVILYSVAQLLEMLRNLHRCKIIHADLKPDNIMIRSVCPLVLQIIDFGRSIDMTLFPEGTTFTHVVTTKDFQCVEMQTNKPWTYQTDLYGLACTAHCFIFGEYMKVCQKGGRWCIKKSFPRHFDKKLWSDFFQDMLNIESCFLLPDLSHWENVMKQNTNMQELNDKLRAIGNMLEGR